MSPSGAICLANARLVLTDRVVTGSLHIEGGRIQEIAECSEVPAGAVDLDGDFLVPGLVELHTDNLERHLLPRPTVALPHNTAILAHDGELASCGITTVFDALRVGSDEKKTHSYGRYARGVATEILALRDAGILRVRHLLHLRAEVCSDTLIEELEEFGPDDRVRLISVMDHTPGERQFRDMAKLRAYYKGKHSWTEAEFQDHVARQLTRRERVGNAHEAAAVSAADRLGATVASHDDTTREQVLHSSDLGMRLAEFPTTVEAAEACREAGMKIIMGAPNLVRGGSHSGNVSAIDLARRGLLDIVSSDYVPSLLMASVFRLEKVWNDLPRAVRAVSETPADATGLYDRGRIREGSVADIARVRLHGDTPVTRAVWRGGQRIG
ncbi:MAG: alpha-D-ribose 1-methylphosphonate 5-triphosphate diphosphatase [Pseudomonadota bacterium]